MQRPVDTTIDPDACTGCGECVRVCPADAITMVEDIAVVSGETSLGCGHCAAVCPADAVTVGFVDDGALRLTTVDGPVRHVAPGDFDTAALVGLMASRRSCRNYTAEPVAREVLEDLVRIATTAPSGTNSQRWTFTILPSRKAVLDLAAAVRGFFVALNRKAANPALRLLSRLVAGDGLGRYYRDYYDTVEEALREAEEGGRERLFHGAPAAILVGSEPGASCPTEDALLASQNILLAAHAMGLGTCLIGFVVSAMAHDRTITRRLGIPDDEKVHAVIAIGHPDETYLEPAGRRQVVPRYHEGTG